MAWGTYSMTPEARKVIYAKEQATQRTNRGKRESEEQAVPLRLDSLRERVADLEAKPFTLRGIERTSAVSAELTDKALLMSHEIAVIALPWEHMTGVHFLLDGDEVVHVEQLLNAYSRTSSYPVNNFSRYVFVSCTAEALDKLESLYIHLLRPKLDRGRLDGSSFVPLVINSLIGSL